MKLVKCRICGVYNNLDRRIQCRKCYTCLPNNCNYSEDLNIGDKVVHKNNPMDGSVPINKRVCTVKRIMNFRSRTTGNQCVSVTNDLMCRDVNELIKVDDIDMNENKNYNDGRLASTDVLKKQDYEDPWHKVELLFQAAKLEHCEDTQEWIHLEGLSRFRFFMCDEMKALFDKRVDDAFDKFCNKYEIESQLVNKTIHKLVKKDE